MKKQETKVKKNRSPKNGKNEGKTENDYKNFKIGPFAKIYDSGYIHSELIKAKGLAKSGNAKENKNK